MTYIKHKIFEKRTYVYELIFLFDSYDSVQFMLKMWLLHSAALYWMHLFLIFTPLWASSISLISFHFHSFVSGCGQMNTAFAFSRSLNCNQKCSVVFYRLTEGELNALNTKLHQIFLFFLKKITTGREHRREIKYKCIFYLKHSGVDFTNILRAAFKIIDPKSVKNTVKSSASSYAFGICTRKKHVWAAFLLKCFAQFFSTYSLAL